MDKKGLDNHVGVGWRREGLANHVGLGWRRKALTIMPAMDGEGGAWQSCWPLVEKEGLDNHVGVGWRGPAIF